MNAIVSNVVSFTDRRELDGIKGHLGSLCAMLNITEATLLLAAQMVQNALHGGADGAQAMQVGIRYAKSHQEPDLEKVEASFRDYQNARQQKRMGDALKSAVDRAFSDGPQPPRNAA